MLRLKWRRCKALVRTKPGLPLHPKTEVMEGPAEHLLQNHRDPSCRAALVFMVLKKVSSLSPCSVPHIQMMKTSTREHNLTKNWSNEQTETRRVKHNEDTLITVGDTRCWIKTQWLIASSSSSWFHTNKHRQTRTAAVSLQTSSSHFRDSIQLKDYRLNSNFTWIIICRLI